MQLAGEREKGERERDREREGEGGEREKGGGERERSLIYFCVAKRHSYVDDVVPYGELRTCNLMFTSKKS